jgi:hypothetical protein
MLSSNRTKFLKDEGLQLMRLILRYFFIRFVRFSSSSSLFSIFLLLYREQTNARNSALKVLSYATNNLDGKESCQAFVEMLGLSLN